jgi:uncharacterized damage-inducible protein DinB
MNATQTARMLTRYNAWSNDIWFKTVADLPEGEATRERKSLFKNMVHTLNHNYVIGRIWQGHLQGRDHGYTARNTPDYPPLAELWKAQRELDAWYVDWSDGVGEDALGEEVRFELIGGTPGVMTRGEILLHVVHHTGYHRGFVGDMFYEIPGKRPPVTDLPVFLREYRGAQA